jgi:hypothetical protein
MSDTNKYLDAMFGPMQPDDRVTTFGMVPMWVRGTGEYQDRYGQLKAKCADWKNWPWRKPVPDEDTIQAMAAIAAMRIVASKLRARLDGIETQASLLEQSLQSIERVCA